MKHFVGYHNYERMEAEAEGETLETEASEAKDADTEPSSDEDEDEYPYGFLTRKKPDRFIKNVIWGIQGQGKPREYSVVSGSS